MLEIAPKSIPTQIATAPGIGPVRVKLSETWYNIDALRQEPPFTFFPKPRFRVRLDDHEIHISRGRRVDATGMSAQTPLCRGVGIAKIGRERHYRSQRGRQPVDVSLSVIVPPQI
jgi:hypothetical protein